MVYSPALEGGGWEPAVLDNEVELDFIKEAQKGLSHFRSYWIGGSTTVDTGNQIEFSEYSATDAIDGNTEIYFGYIRIDHISTSQCIQIIYWVLISLPKKFK